LHLSALIEDRWLENGPDWWRSALVSRALENYLGSGLRFVYLQTAIAG
jgi:hypothetical protein